MTGPDSTGKEFFFATDATDEVLGVAVMDALRHSKYLPLAEHRDFYDPQANAHRCEDWVLSLMSRYEYKTRRALFADMKNCGIELAGDDLIFKPTHHIKREVWERRKSDNFEDVKIHADSLPAEIGAALRLGFNRCI